MKRKWIALLLALTLLSSLTVAGANALEGKVVTGCTVQLTGPNQLTGSYYQNGIKMAVAEINAAGGILGKELVMEYADEGSDPQMAVNACEKLLSMDVMAVFGSITSTNCKAMLPSIKEKGVPFYAFGSNPTMADEGAPWLWQLRVRDSLTAPIMAEVFHNQLGVKKPAIIYNTAESTTLSTQAFVGKYKEMGIEIDPKYIYACTEDETNFANIISQIMASDCDGVQTAIVNSNQAVVLAQQLHSAGINLPVLGNSVFSSPEFRKADPVASEGWYCVVEWTSSLLNGNLPEGIPQAAVDFETKYEAQFNIGSAAMSVQGYDAVYLFKAACEAAGTTEDRNAINEAMKKTDAQGAGNYYKYIDSGTLTTYILLLQNHEGQAVPSAVVPTI